MRIFQSFLFSPPSPLSVPPTASAVRQVRGQAPSGESAGANSPGSRKSRRARRVVGRAAGAPAVLAVTLQTALFAAEPQEAYVITADTPADNWELAHPVGNGRLGAMAFGAYPKERILLNEETVWAKVDPQTMPEDSAGAVAEISELIRRGDFAAADRVFKTRLLSGHEPSPYQLLGNLWIEHLATSEATPEIHRELRLWDGVARTVLEFSDGSVIRELAACGRDDVLVLSVSTTRPEGLHVRLSLSRPALGEQLKNVPETVDGRPVDAVEVRIEDQDLVLAGEARTFRGGRLYTGGTRFLTRARVHLEGPGKIQTTESSFELWAERGFSVRIAAATDYNRRAPFEPLAVGWERNTSAALDRIDTIPVSTLIERAGEEVREYLSRCRLDLGETPEEIRRLTTAERRRRLAAGGQDPDLLETYFQFGRYLLAASSRPGTLPANLQGIWNPFLEPPWSSDYHLNINLQMNYWPAEPTALSELHLPLMDFIEMLVPAGREMARRLGCRGVATGHATDVWTQARLMSSEVYWGGSFLSWQWLVTHAAEHWRFTRDLEFLSRRGWPLQVEAVEFCLSWLQRDPATGLWVAGPSASPENSFTYSTSVGPKTAAVNLGNSFDQYLIRQTFTDLLESAGVLHREDDPLVSRVRDVLPELYLPGVDSKGRLMEWREEYEEPEPGHRHISHLLGVYPGNQVLPLRDAKMKRAVEASLSYRLEHGGGHTGWSRAWITGLYARLGDGARAYENLVALLDKSTLDNLFDSHPPFQIDGNFGAVAAVAEMLLQSHETDSEGNPFLRLLPALPPAWREGEVIGLRARGGLTANLAWREGKPVEATLRATVPVECTVAYGERTKRVALDAGEEQRLTF